MMDMSSSPKVPRSHRRIDPAEAQRRMANGETAKALGLKWGVTATAISNAIRRAGLAPANVNKDGPRNKKIDAKAAHARLDAGADIDALCRELRCKRKSLFHAMRQAGLPPLPRRKKAKPAPQLVAEPAVEKLPHLRVAPPVPALRVVAAEPAPDLPQGYIGELIATKGKYLALESWRAKFAPLIGRDIGAAKALQEWHRYRSG